jgi:hypothetical protein
MPVLRRRRPRRRHGLSSLPKRHIDRGQCHARWDRFDNCWPVYPRALGIGSLVFKPI